MKTLIIVDSCVDGVTRIISDKCGIHGSEDSYCVQSSGLLPHVSGTVATDVQ
jgi:hypothetical protein